MKKAFFAVTAVVCMLTMGTGALAAEAASWRIGHHDACHRKIGYLFKDMVRHDCVYADADGDGFCDGCGWHQDRHHCVDDNGFCLNEACGYESCGYGYEAGYCRGNCNSSVTAELSSGRNQENPAERTDPANAVPEEGGAGSYGYGHHGSGHHGGGHHGNGRHGCGY